MEIRCIKETLAQPDSLRKKLGVAPIGEKIGLSEERVRESLGRIRDLVSYFREYPDIFLDCMRDPSERFEFHYYQRVFLRAACRHRYMYATFPRAYSKSFLSVMALMVQCIFYPNSKLFIVSGGKEQSARIAEEKIQELFKFFPFFKEELVYGPEKTRFQRDYIRLVFKNGSILDIVGAKASSRGIRKTGGLIEESATVDGQVLSEVIIPTMNVSRRAAFGAEDKNDITNKRQIYITTAGDKGTFAYDKMVQIYLWSLMRPDESICIGGSWRVPVICGLLDKNFVKDLKDDGTYSEEVFGREYESKWGGGNLSSYFSPSEFDKSRVISKPLWEAPYKVEKGSKFIIGYDVGRVSDDSSVVIMQLVPTSIKGNLTYTKKIVNLYGFEKMHFSEQALEIKKLFLRFQASKLIIDANGIGIGLVDFLTMPTEDPRTGETLPPFGVDKESDPKNDYSKFYKTKHGIDGAIYLIKAGGGSNGEMHTLCSAQIASDKVQFLIDETVAMERMKRSVTWNSYTQEKKIEMIRPYKMTKILKDEMMNLRKKNPDGIVALQKIAAGIKKDKFSAFEYALYYARRLELKSKKTSLGSSLGLSTSAERGHNKTTKNVATNRQGFNRGDRNRGGWRRG